MKDALELTDELIVLDMTKADEDGDCCPDCDCGPDCDCC